MYLMYNDTIHIFQNNNLELNILFLKLKQTYPSYSKDQINALLNLYFSKKNYGCEYSYKVEKQLEKIFNIIKKNQ